jgi:TRAP transporter TAXI family solute receptor
MPLTRRTVALGTVMLAAVPARGQAVKIRLGTATPGGGFPVYGEAFIAAIKAQDPALEIEAINTKGSTENVPMLEDGRLDIALVQGEVVHESLNGIGRPPANLRVLTAMYPTAGLFVIRADSPLQINHRSQGQADRLGRRRLGPGDPGRYVMDGLGLDAAKDFQPIYLERAGDGPAMVLDGRVAALWGGGAGWPGFKTVMASPQGGRFIAPTAEEIRRVLSQAFVPQADQPARRQLSRPERRRSRRSAPGVSCWRARLWTARSWLGSPRRCTRARPRVSRSLPRRRRRTRSRGHPIHAASRRAGLLQTGGLSP